MSRRLRASPGSGARLRAAARLSRPEQVLLIWVVYAAGCVAGSASGRGAGAATAGEVVLVAAAIGAVAVSVHAVNEYADADTDAVTLRTRFSGGSGALAAYQLPATFALRCAQVAALAAGAVIAAGWANGRLSSFVAVLLALGLCGGWAYSVGPWPFSRHGVGEVANAALGGLLLPTTGAVVVGAPASWAVVAFVPFALLDFVNLLETQWADREADRVVGKRTLASRLSPRSVRSLGGASVLLAYAVSVSTAPRAVALAGLLALPLSIYGVWRLGRGSPGPSVGAMIVFLLAQAVAWQA